MSFSNSGVRFSTRGDEVDMHVLQGKTLTFSYILGGDTPLDVTGYTAVWQARAADGSLILEASTTDGRITTGGADGTFSVQIPASASAAISAKGGHEMELTSASGTVSRAMKGNFSYEARLIS